MTASPQQILYSPVTKVDYVKSLSDEDVIGSSKPKSGKITTDCRFVMSETDFERLKEKLKEIIKEKLNKYTTDTEKADEEIVKDAINILKQITIQTTNADIAIKSINDNLQSIEKDKIKREQHRNAQQILVNIKKNAEQVKNNGVAVVGIADVVSKKLSLLDTKEGQVSKSAYVGSVNKKHQIDLSQLNISGTVYGTGLFGLGKVDKFEGAQLVGVDALRKVFSVIYKDKLIETDKLCKLEKPLSV